MSTNEKSTLIVPAIDNTLVLIDMQPIGFPYAKWVLRPVLQHLDAAIALHHGVCLVDYLVDIAGPIEIEIMERLKGYPRLIQTRKAHEDGSAEVLQACKDAQLSTEWLQVAGVTTDDCITKTAHGLAALLPESRIDVIKECCTCWDARYDWSKFALGANVFPV